MMAIDSRNLELKGKLKKAIDALVGYGLAIQDEEPHPLSIPARKTAKELLDKGWIENLLGQEFCQRQRAELERL